MGFLMICIWMLIFYRKWCVFYFFCIYRVMWFYICYMLGFIRVNKEVVKLSYMKVCGLVVIFRVYWKEVGIKEMFGCRKCFMF